MRKRRDHQLRQHHSSTTPFASPDGSSSTHDHSVSCTNFDVGGDTNRGSAGARTPIKLEPMPIVRFPTVQQSSELPAKPLTLDLMETLELYLFISSKNAFLSKCVLQKKKEENESFRGTFNLQIQFCPCLVHDSSEEVTELPRKGSVRCKVRCCYQTLLYHSITYYWTGLLANIGPLISRWELDKFKNC